MIMLYADVDNSGALNANEIPAAIAIWKQVRELPLKNEEDFRCQFSSDDFYTNMTILY